MLLSFTGTTGTQVPFSEGSFIQYVADNVDHNICTLDGHGTFHGMGIIAAITPEEKLKRTISKIKVTAEDVNKVAGINIKYHKAATPSDSLRYNIPENFPGEFAESNLDLLWKCSVLFGKPVPSWAGVMETFHKGPHPGKAFIKFLPMIDLNSSDPTCVYSTLAFVADHAKKLNCVPIITFDQPLWWKAVMLVAQESDDLSLKSVVVRLGGFHAEMSFLGAIGTLMAGSGLNEVLQTVYASVDHLLSGKAISRAVRGHLLVDQVLSGMIISQALTDSSGEQPIDQNDILSQLETIYGDCLEEQVLIGSPHLLDLQTSIEAIKEALKDSRTSQLWIQYSDMIYILRKFISAERTGNWKLHLQSLTEMLPYLAAAGHNLYAKSLSIYLENMNNLSVTHPDVYKHFEEGKHVIRRSNKEWGGLSTDLVIEQELMRSLKTSGGLTRGSGMSETQRNIWVLSRPTCGQVNIAMQNVTGVHQNSREQIRDFANSRQQRDFEDCNTIKRYLSDHNPFIIRRDLVNISSGMHADSRVNVDRAREIGVDILKSMHGKSPKDFKFKRKDHAVTLAVKSCVKIDNEHVQIDPNLMFQRLASVAVSSEESLKNAMKYELCSSPPALFESCGLMKEAKKTQIAEGLMSLAEPESHTLSNKQYVIDGGALLHKIPWEKQKPIKAIIQAYRDFVRKNYGCPLVVFDGYETSSTKDMTHRRRKKGQTGVEVTFNEQTILVVSKDVFLINDSNKKNLISMLAKGLEDDGCKIKKAEGDADLLMCLETIKAAESNTTVLIGDDTDLLILLLFHSKQTSNDIHLQSLQDKGKKDVCINSMKDKLGADICESLPFLHALLGCDTTSRLHGIGKGLALKKFKNNEAFRKMSETFMTPNKTQEEVYKAGETALLIVYNAKGETSLNSFRHNKFLDKVSTKMTQVDPSSLPPTSSSAKFHSLRVYLQCQQWRTLDCVLKAEDWGWRLDDSDYVPVVSDMGPAPPELLKVIRCTCKRDCNNRSCSCKKYGKECSLACSNCRGTSCSNSQAVDFDDYSPDDI